MGMYDFLKFGSGLVKAGQSIMNDRAFRNEFPEDFKIYELIIKAKYNTGISFESVSGKLFPTQQSKTKGFSSEFLSELWVDPYVKHFESAYYPEMSNYQTGFSILPLMKKLHRLCDIGRFVPYAKVIKFFNEFEQPAFRSSYPYQFFDANTTIILIENQIRLMENYHDLYKEMITEYLQQRIEITHSLQIVGSKAQKVIENLNKNQAKVGSKISSDARNSVSFLVENTFGTDFEDVNGYKLWGIRTNHPEIVTKAYINYFNQIIFMSSIDLGPEIVNDQDLLMPLNILIAKNGNFNYNPDNNQYVYKSGFSPDKHASKITKEHINSFINIHNQTANWLLLFKFIREYEGDRYYEAFSNFIQATQPQISVDSSEDIGKEFSSRFLDIQRTLY